MGASHETGKELRRGFVLLEDIMEVTKKYKDLQERLRHIKNWSILELANRIYLNNRLSLVPEFNRLTRDAFNAEVEAISPENPEKAASIVNKWVNDTTHGRIKDIVFPYNVDS